MAAVSQDGEALQFSANEYKEDREIVRASVSQNGDALQYAAEHLKADKDVIMAALFAPNITKEKTCLCSVEITTFIPKELYGDEEITFRLIDLYGDDLPLIFLYCFVRKYSNLLALE
mmetsp:Transcript_3668/g.2158  ORF Transcript_3668/g.2158 Transcript_3668/m.2158 type:complete len:117 (-) Transcript_3668:27-377(-)